MLRSEAIAYAIDWLRALQGLSTVVRHVEAVRLLSEPCVWREDEDGVWWTACGQGFCFDGTPTEHNHPFCGYCGAAIREVRHGA